MAQTKRSAGTVVQNLDSDDPLIRLTARKQLALLGPEAMSTMDKAMANLDSSYRVKLGVIVAANEMKGFRPEAFSPRAWCEVWWAAQTGDETMKGQANLLLKKQTKRIDTQSCAEIRLKDYQSRTATQLQDYKSVSAAKKK